MKPRDVVRGCVRFDRPGIEIGPGFNPLAPKRSGYPTTTLDVISTEGLRESAERRGIPAERIAALETVDIVGDACNILELMTAFDPVRSYGWIVSSHNFEHLPDPIAFLTGCRALLSDDGTLGMIIPDKRFCFDRFQPHTTVGGLLRARSALDDKSEPAWAAFEKKLLGAHLSDNTGSRKHAWSDDTDAPDSIMVNDCRPAFRILREKLASERRVDFHGHRWRFTPAAFQLLILDLRVLGLIEFEIDLMGDTVGTEFGVRMKPAEPYDPSPEEFAAQRSGLLHRIEDELAMVSGAYRRLQAKFALAAGA